MCLCSAITEAADSQSKGSPAVLFQGNAAAALPIAHHTRVRRISRERIIVLLHGLPVVEANAHARTDEMVGVVVEQVGVHATPNHVQIVIAVESKALDRGFPRQAIGVPTWSHVDAEINEGLNIPVA